MNNFDPIVPVSRLSDKDMRGAPAALVRAARRAREIAARTGTPLIVIENGRVVEKVVGRATVPPSDEEARNDRGGAVHEDRPDADPAT